MSKTAFITTADGVKHTIDADKEDFVIFADNKEHLIKDLAWWTEIRGDCIYAKTTIGNHVQGKYVKHNYYLHRAVMGLLGEPSVFLDHINRNTTDSRLCNLRRCTPRQNVLNSKPRSGCLYKGVTFVKSKEHGTKYRGVVEGKTIGYFWSTKFCAMAVDLAKLDSADAEFHYLNFPRLRLLSKTQRDWMANSIRTRFGIS